MNPTRHDWDEPGGFEEELFTLYRNIYEQNKKRFEREECEPATPKAPKAPIKSKPKYNPLLLLL